MQGEVELPQVGEGNTGLERLGGKLFGTGKAVPMNSMSALGCYRKPRILYRSMANIGRLAGSYLLSTSAGVWTTMIGYYEGMLEDFSKGNISIGNG